MEKMRLFLVTLISLNWRCKMTKLKFMAISPVVLSPRMEKALYKGVDFKNIEKDIKNSNIVNVDKINIIYPFYSYEERDLLPENKFLYAEEYYVPASSLKGALLSSITNEDDNSFRSKILFQDIKLNGENIELKNLYKFQYLYQDNKEKNVNDTHKIPKFEPFFPSVAIEMIEGGKEFECEILSKAPERTEKILKNRLKKTFCDTRGKLSNYKQEIENRIKEIESWIEKNQELQRTIKKLEEIKGSIQNQINSDKNMIFLGGYKGSLGSLSEINNTPKIRNGFYIDKETMLPYGLLEVNVE